MKRRNDCLFNKANLATYVGKTCACGNNVRRNGDSSCINCVQAGTRSPLYNSDEEIVKRRRAVEDSIERKKLKTEDGYGDI